ncbi:hypothetical protein L1887_41827 [Cichorium endivia]|nr:hypothetical protein L1887_41827 [Cichorium endivia]
MIAEQAATTRRLGKQQRREEENGVLQPTIGHLKRSRAVAATTIGHRKRRIQWACAAVECVSSFNQSIVVYTPDIGNNLSQFVVLLILNQLLLALTIFVGVVLGVLCKVQYFQNVMRAGYCLRFNSDCSSLQPLHHHRLLFQ